MVKNPHIHQRKCILQNKRQALVSARWSNSAAWVIVSKHHTSAIQSQGPFNHFTRIDTLVCDKEPRNISSKQSRPF